MRRNVAVCAILLAMGLGAKTYFLTVKDGRICWQAGGGIVHDSDPAMEWNEVCNKSAIMRAVLDASGDSHVSAHR